LDPSAAADSTTLLHLTTAGLQTAEQDLHNSSAPELLQAN
jgi:hypothetical protein